MGFRAIWSSTCDGSLPRGFGRFHLHCRLCAVYYSTNHRRGKPGHLYASRDRPDDHLPQVFCGLPWGVFQTLTTTYASEVCPIQLRGYLTAFVNLGWGLGILISSSVVRGTLGIESNWSERPSTGNLTQKIRNRFTY
jgi:MFS family permease